jgi:osmotically-inducible protein OsmY
MTRRTVYGALALLLTVLAGCADPTAPLDVATTVAEDRPMGQVAHDTKIKLDFDRRLVAGKDRDLFFNLASDVYERRLMLTGSVRSERDRERAVALARGTEGVRVVYDELQVKEKGGFG